jgi:hypothetical protein
MFDAFGAPSCDGDTLLQLVGKFLTKRPHSPDKHESSLASDYARLTTSPYLGARLCLTALYTTARLRRASSQNFICEHVQK